MILTEKYVVVRLPIVNECDVSVMNERLDVAIFEEGFYPWISACGATARAESQPALWCMGDYIFPCHGRPMARVETRSEK